MSTTNPIPTLGSTRPILVLNAPTDPAFIDPVLLVKRTITQKDYSDVKKKKKINLVTFNTDKRFWTIDEAEEDADKTKS